MSARDQLAYAAGALTPARKVTKLLDAHEAEVLRKAADRLVTFCPDHGDRDTAFIACQCLAADDLRRQADQTA